MTFRFKQTFLHKNFIQKNFIYLIKLYVKYTLILIPYLSTAQIPSYYSGINFNLNADALKQELSQLIITTHTTILPYTSSTMPDTWDALKQSDLDLLNSDNVLLIYGWNDLDAVVDNDRTRDKNLSCHSSDCLGKWVREHTYPRSLGTPNLGFENAGSDAHNLRPIDNTRNGTRSNNKFAAGIGQASYKPAVLTWYPGDEWKGDVARMIMYMYLRYPTQCLPTNVGVGSSSYSTYGDMPNIFLEWNAEDPVAAHELMRNNVLQGMQGNRNPFIDNPYLATLIWNGPQAEDKWDLEALSSGVSYNYIVKIILYPTLTSDYVNIAPPNGNTFQYVIYNQMGQKIISGKTIDKIDVSSYSSGMYFIKLAVNNQYNTFKIIKL